MKLVEESERKLNCRWTDFVSVAVELLMSLKFHSGNTQQLIVNYTSTRTCFLAWIHNIVLSINGMH